MTLFHSPSVQSPKAYDLANLQGDQIVTRINAAPTNLVEVSKTKWDQTAIEAAASVVPVNYYYPPGHVYRYGTNTSPGTTDMTAALNNSIKAVGSGGTVIWPADQYKTTAPILAENFRGLTIQAASGQQGWNGTRIMASHTGKAILSLKGSLFVNIIGLALEAISGFPKTGLMLGRSSAASAGGHRFNALVVGGTYSVAGVYNIASEENVWIGCSILCASVYTAFEMAGTDGALTGTPVDGMTGSSMESNSFFGCTIGNTDGSAGTAAVRIDSSIATGHIHFYGCFFSQNGGEAYVFLVLGGVDGQGTIFPISLYGCAGEPGATGPVNGVRIVNVTSTQPLVLHGFAMQQCRWQGTTTNNILCNGSGSGTVQLSGAKISTPPTNSGGKPSTFQNCTQCDLDLQFETSVTISGVAAGNIIRTSGTAKPTIGTDSGNVVMRAGTGSITSLPQGGFNGSDGAAPVTGWGTSVGGGPIANFNAGTANLANCATVIAQIVTTLKAYGIWGA